MQRNYNIEYNDSDEFIPIVSPVNGIITPMSNNKSIRIYISPTDNHDVFSPMDGVITNITTYNGKWTRQIFEAYIDKIARVTIEINNSVNFFIEVGYPEYITDRIRIRKKIGNRVSLGEHIGQIILGSMVELHLQKGQFYIPDYVRSGLEVVGGQTILAYQKQV